MPKEHWSIPSWIDEERAQKARDDMAARNIIYGGSLPYRHMCRFQSGFFFRQPLMDEYDWYWRVVWNPVTFIVDVVRNQERIITVTLITMCLSLWI